jgi:transposase
VYVANASRLGLIHGRPRKNDRADAEALARLARLDPGLLAPVRHRGERAQNDLARLRARDALVAARTKLVNHVRGASKAVGGRVPRCSTESFPAKAVAAVPPTLLPAVSSLLSVITALTGEVRRCDREVRELAARSYPETALLEQVAGVGPITALRYILTLEDPLRFRTSRSVAFYLGLTPRQVQSGDQDPERHIHKAGDQALRYLLVQCAQRVLGPFGPDSDLRRWGLALACRGRKNAKKRAVVAVARKLAVLLHRLWVSGEVYEPIRTATVGTLSRSA